jgi:hypothetical protein
VSAKDDAEHELIGEQIAAFERWMRALGQFIVEFARTELTLYRVLLHHAGVTDAVGRAMAATMAL